MRQTQGFSSVYAHDLSIGGGFGVFAFRVAARGLAGCWTVQECFERALASDGPDALSAVSRFARALGTQGRRKITLAMPSCVRITADELSFLSAMAASQAQAVDAYAAHLTWLFAGSAPEPAVNALACFSDTLAVHDLWVETLDPSALPIADPLTLNDAGPDAAAVTRLRDRPVPPSSSVTAGRRRPGRHP